MVIINQLILVGFDGLFFMLFGFFLIILSVFYSQPLKVMFFYVVSLFLVFMFFSFFFRFFLILLPIILLVGGVYLLMVYLMGLSGYVFWYFYFFYILFFISFIIIFSYNINGFEVFFSFFRFWFILFFFMFFFKMLFLVNFFLVEKKPLRVFYPAIIIKYFYFRSRRLLGFKGLL